MYIHYNEKQQIIKIQLLDCWQLLQVGEHGEYG